MSDQTTRARRLYRDVYLPAYAEIAATIGIPRSDVADKMLLAIAGQEADFHHRYQVLNSGAKGPARGLWQFERMGGVEGVLTHKRTRAKAIALCEQRGIPPRRDEVWPALEFDDALALGFARLLLWSDPRPLPNGANAAWMYYLRNWRPGKPHPDRWSGNWSAATAAVGKTPVAEEAPAAEEAPVAEEAAPAEPDFYPPTDGLQVTEMNPTESTERVTIVISHFNAEGAVLSTLTLEYPTINNAAANALQLDIVDGMTNVIRSYAQAKATQAGETWPETR